MSQSGPRRSLRATACAVALSAALLATHAAATSSRTTREPQSRTPVVRGEVVETACFVMGNRRGPLHRACALACARAGQELGILDDRSRTLFVLLQDYREHSPGNPLLEYLAGKVEVSGEIVERGGVKAIVPRQIHLISPPA